MSCIYVATASLWIYRAPLRATPSATSRVHTPTPGYTQGKEDTLCISVAKNIVTVTQCGYTCDDISNWKCCHIATCIIILL